jgi:PadR family transcriptional regulator AphA
MRDLTSTSHVLLAFINTRPYSAYELVTQLSNTLRYVWPKAERNVYYELRNLAERGLAEAKTEATGKRKRTTYQITPAGHDALQQWFAMPPTGLLLEFEALVRVFFADATSKQQLVATLNHIRADMLAWQADGRVISESYLNGTAPSLPRANVTSLIFPFFWGLTEFVLGWTAMVEAEIADWPDLLPNEETSRRALERFQLPAATARR